MAVSTETMRGTAAKAAALAAMLCVSCNSGTKQDDEAARIAVGFLKRRELYRALPYDDGFGNVTIGYGHVIRSGESINGPLTPDEATALLVADFEKHRQGVDAITGSANLRPNQRAALYSFEFNCGKRAITDSGIRAAIEAGELKKVPKLMAKYNQATDRKTGQKRVVRGLVARRAAEIELWNSTETIK